MGEADISACCGALIDTLRRPAGALFPAKYIRQLKFCSGCGLLLRMRVIKLSNDLALEEWPDIICDESDITRCR